MDIKKRQRSEKTMTDATQAIQERPRSAWEFVYWSYCFPGFGQWMMGRKTRGVLWFLFTEVGIICEVDPIV